MFLKNTSRDQLLQKAYSLLSFLNFIFGAGKPSNSQVSVTFSPLSRDENVVFCEDLSRIKTGLSAMKSDIDCSVNVTNINFEEFFR